jgi:GNAT superfamily N-acetyltransferase
LASTFDLVESRIETPSAPEAHEIVVTTLSDGWLDRAGELLARSFIDEPGFTWTLGGTPERRRRVLALSFRASLRGRRRSIELHGAFIRGRLVGVGVRFPPGRWPMRRQETLPGLPWRLVGLSVRAWASRRSVRRLLARPAVERLHVDYPPHWYLWLMGVHPASRRQGVATALARYVTRQADEAGVGCYLETFGDSTEALYRGFGFRVRERFEIGPEAPVGRTMWREPQVTSVGSIGPGR